MHSSANDSLLTEFSHYLTSAEKHEKKLQERFEKGLYYDEQNKKLILETGQIDRLFDNIPAKELDHLITSESEKLFSEIIKDKDDTDVEAKRLFFNQLTRQAVNIILTPEGKLTPAMMDFLETHDKGFSQKYSQLPLAQQKSFNQSLVFSLAHAIEVSYSTKYADKLNQNKIRIEIPTEALEKKVNKDHIIPILNKKNLEFSKLYTALSATEKQVVQDTFTYKTGSSHTIIEFFSNPQVLSNKEKLINFNADGVAKGITMVIPAQISAPLAMENYINQCIESEATSELQEEEAIRLNRVYGLNLPKTTDIQTTLLKKIGKDFPQVVTKSVEKWTQKAAHKPDAERVEIAHFLYKSGANTDQISTLLKVETKPQDKKENPPKKTPQLTGPRPGR